MASERPSVAPRMIACLDCPLRRLTTFHALEPSQIAFIQSQKVGELVVQARGSILREGDTPERFSTLLSGWAFRFKTLQDGRRQILNVLLPGDLVGLQAKLFDLADHGVEALTDARLCLFSRDRMWEFFQTHPKLAYDMTWLCAHEETMVDESLLSVGRRSAAEAMAAFILYLFRRAAALGLGDARTMPMPLTQAHLADALGLSPVHANRTLRLMRQRKLFELSGGALRHVDVVGLAKLSGAGERSLDPRPLI